MPALPQLLPGHVFARDFRVLAPLAEGGMGAVYVVEQLSTGKRRALKVMLPQLVEDARARERFAQESRIGGHIESEHVVEVVSAGVDEPSGVPWLAMELLEGRDLSSAVRERGAISPAEACEIFQQLGDGLGAAHAKGIVHRDLKPENLFIAVSRRRGVPFTLKILDFGIAKLTQESRATASSTAAVGSPMWMAPEQTEQHARLRPATDVWALGLVAFHVLTGRFYWRVANQPEVRLTALFTEVLVTPIEAASIRAAQLGVGHLVPPGFDAWLARCLDRDPERRWPDARAAVAALTPVLGMRDAAMPMTTEQPRALGAAPRVVAPTLPMSAAPGQPLAPLGQHTPAYPPSQYPPGPPGTTPYAVHAPSTATGALAQPPAKGRAVILALGMFSALVGAGLSAFAGLMIWQRVSDDSDPARVVGHGEHDAGLVAHPAIDAATLAVVVTDGGTIPLGVDLTDTERPHDAGLDAGQDAGLDAGRARAAASTTDDGEPAASARFEWADGAMQRWRGTWSGQGWRYAVTLQLNRNGGAVSGTIEWRLLETSSEEHRARVGDRAEEWVTGTYEAGGALSLRGYQTSDPTLVNPDQYDLRIAASGAVSGLSHSDGGRLTARPFR